MEEADKIFLEYVVKALVDNPNDVKIDRTVDERMGNTAKAIRTLLRIIGMKNNARVNLKINEPAGSMRPERPAGSMSSAPTLKTVDQAMEDLKGI